MVQFANVALSSVVQFHDPWKCNGIKVCISNKPFIILSRSQQVVGYPDVGGHPDWLSGLHRTVVQFIIKFLVVVFCS